uniref:Putative secreted protein n=1 Tax=Ixodes ricinus TaxID=34613 RepID=A0A6B0TS34_IXORI
MVSCTLLLLSFSISISLFFFFFYLDVIAIAVIAHVVEEGNDEPWRVSDRKNKKCRAYSFHRSPWFHPRKT